MSDNSAREADRAPHAHLALVAAAVTILPLLVWTESFRPFVGPKLLAALALGSLALPLLAVGPGLERVGRAALVAFGAYVLAYGTATVFSLDPAVSLMGDARRGMGFATRLSLVAVALVTAGACAGRPEAVRFVLRVVLAVCVLESVYLLLQAYRLDPLVDPILLEQTNRAGVVEVRVVGTLGHPNFLGHMLLFGIGAAVALVRLERGRIGRLAASAGGFVTAVGVVAAGSRGAWVGLAVQVVIGAAFAARTGGARRFVLGAIAILALATVTTVLVVRGPLAEQLAARVEAFRTDNLTGSGRTILWRDAAPMPGRYALHGTGPEVFARAFLPYHSADLVRAEPYAVYDSTHNVLLDAAIVAGVGGLASLLGLLGVAFASLVRVSRARPSDALASLGIGLGIVGYLVGGMFVFDTIATGTFIYLFVALAVASASGAESAVEARPVWRPALAVLLLLAAAWALWPRLWLVWRSDAQMAAAERSVVAGSASEAIAFGRAAVENALALGPVPEQRRLLVRIYARVGDTSRAPTDDERILLEEGRAEAARALDHSTTPHRVLAELGNLSLRLGDFDGVERAFREAIAVAPNYWYAHARLAYVLSARGADDEARREAALALELNPESGGQEPDRR